MLYTRLTNCIDCTTIPALLKDIDCKLTELANDQYNNIVFSLNKYISGELIPVWKNKNYTTKKIKNTCIIPAGEPYDLGIGESVKIDEAGLYFVLNSAVDPDNDPPIYSNPKLFAHICFAPKWKEKESQLTIIWYILC